MAAKLSFAEFQVCAAVLIAATGRPMNDKTVDVYYDCLSDIPFEVLQAACKRAIQEQKDTWFPAVGVIRAHAAELMYGAIPSWSDEWDRVRKLVRKFDISRRTEAYSHMPAITQQAVTAVGWASICDSETISIHAAQFRAAYESLAARESSMRRISEDVRPRITAGNAITLDVQARPTLRIAQQLADSLPAIEEKGAQCPSPRK